MSVHILDAMTREGFEETLVIHHRRSGLRAILAIHDTTRGPAFGGIRRREYRDEREMLLDCLRLSRAMTHKAALLDLPIGGSKIVLAEDEDVDWDEAYRHIGDRIEEMGGRVYTGPDVSTGPMELARVAERTRYVTDPGEDGPGELAEATAEGVFQGIAAGLRAKFSETDWAQRRIVVQGLGAVGAALAQRLVATGAEVIGADIDEDRAHEVSERLGFECVDAAVAIDQVCDVFSPNALGGLLHDVTLERLNCEVVAGSANNQLAHALVGDELFDLGVLYVPDFVINAGALVRGALFHLEGRREPVEAIGLRIGAAAERVLRAAVDEDDAPDRVAKRLAATRIDEWRAAADEA
ncbi:MAG: Glu/Leu/Phe/Val dehydrogenase dimerization domain-containing protein [Planctomycetota bacterium]